MNPREAGAIAKLVYGGPHHGYAGLQLVSNRGAAIKSLIEIYRHTDYPFHHYLNNFNKTN